MGTEHDPDRSVVDVLEELLVVLITEDVVSLGFEVWTDELVTEVELLTGVVGSVGVVWS